MSRAARFVLPLAVAVMAIDAQAALAQEPPAWLRLHMEFMTRGSGRWIADNAAWVSAQETDDAYGMEWTWGPGRQSIRGRLFGLREGRETGTYWEFRVYWNPARREAVAFQWHPTGLVGEGTMTAADAGTRLDQTFANPDGSTSRVLHESIDQGDRHETRSFGWIDGRWQPRRNYVWLRAAGGQP